MVKKSLKMDDNRHIVVLMDMPLFPYRIYCYNELVKRGYDLTVISISQKKQEYGLPLLFHHVIMQSKKIGPFVKIKKFHMCDFDNYDMIIFALDVRYLDYLYLLMKRTKKMIAWGHMKGHSSGNPIAQMVRVAIARKLPAIIFYDYQTQNEYLKKGFPKEKLFVANNTQYVDPSTVAFKKERSYFLYVGRIQPRKGLDVALKAFAKMLKNTNNDFITFKIVGGGDNCELKQIANEFEIIDRVDFVGPVHDEKKLGEIFSGALAYVSPGHVGLGVLHSFAFGLPVLTCNDRRHSVEYANCTDNNSYLVPYTIDDVSRAMYDILTDKSLRETKSQNAYDYYNQYCTIDKMVDGVDDAIKYVLETK